MPHKKQRPAPYFRQAGIPGACKIISKTVDSTIDCFMNDLTTPDTSYIIAQVDTLVFSTRTAIAEGYRNTFFAARLYTPKIFN